jgi:hypothetical protein
MNRKDAWFWLSLTALLCAVGILYFSALAAARMAEMMG